MKADIKHFNSQGAAKILNVNVSTIKRWTDEGKLECIKTAGGHRKFLMSHLSNYVNTYKNKNTEINLFPIETEADLQISYRIMKGDYEYLVNYMMEQALSCRQDNLQQVLNGLYLGQHPLYTIYDKVITPIMHRFGDLWHNNELTIIEEHFGSQTIRDSLIRLQGIINIPSRKIGRAFCMNLSSELHDIALKMVAHILELRGFQVYFSGQNTNVFKIEQAFEKFKPNRLYISCTWVEDIEKTQEEFNRILKICQEYKTDIFLGGRGIYILNLDHQKIVTLIDTFEQLYYS